MTRRWYQLRLRTKIVLAFVVLVLLWLNFFKGLNQYQGLAKFHVIHTGWPLDVTVYKVFDDDLTFKPFGLLVDIVVAVAILVLVAFVCEGLLNNWEGKDWKGGKRGKIIKTTP